MAQIYSNYLWLYPTSVSNYFHKSWIVINTASLILPVIRRGWSPWWCTTILAPIPENQYWYSCLAGGFVWWILVMYKYSTCGCSVSVVISLGVNHQFESVALPTGAVRPPMYLRVWPPNWVEVNLKEKECLGMPRGEEIGLNRKAIWMFWYGFYR